MTPIDPDERTRQIARESLANGDPTGWFERLYADAERGLAIVPWDRGTPHRLLSEWVAQRNLDGRDKWAIVVGCGLGEDAELAASLGFETTAFDISQSGIRAAQQRFPDSPVHYETANLLDLPAAWRSEFDLVIEIFTVQALPEALHPQATAAVSSLVAPGGTLIVIAAARDAEDAAVAGPPWPLTRSEIDAFATNGLQPVGIERLADSSDPDSFRWRVEFHRLRDE